MDNVDFFIKGGDRSPDITATLKDRTGAAVDVTGKTVNFIMRSFETGVVLINAPAEVLADPGKVRYQWAAGDTDAPGYYFAEWQVDLSPGVTQTFPTSGWHLIEITADLDGGSLSSTNFVLIRDLRRLVAEPDTSNYSDTLLNAMLVANGNDLNVTAAQVWREKAADYAQLVDVSESGSSRKMSQLYDRAIAQARTFEGAGGVIVDQVSRPRINRIVRPS